MPSSEATSCCCASRCRKASPSPRYLAPIANAALGIPVDSFMAAANDPAGASAFVPGAMSFEGLLLPETHPGAGGRHRARPGADHGAAGAGSMGPRLGVPGWTAWHDTAAFARARLHHRGRGAGQQRAVGDFGGVLEPDQEGDAAEARSDRAVRHPDGDRISQAPVASQGLRLQVAPAHTYLNTGLPPGPVNSPGRASIEAALYPAPVPYLFFVAAGDGHHVFTRTYGEHLRAISKIRRARCPELTDSTP